MTFCKKIMVMGTDTDVGKTVLSLLIMQNLTAKGKKPFYLKPFQTGCVGPSDSTGDAAFIHRHTPGLGGIDPAPSVLNCHKNPKAPWFAARDMGQTINLPRTMDQIKEKESSHSHLVIEAAGGLLVPLTETLTVADFIKQSKARPVIAARAGLGTINHTLMTVECLRARGITPGGIVFMETPQKEEKTSKTMIQENMEAVEKFSNVPVAGFVKNISDFQNPDPDALKIVECLLKSCHFA
ncbi:dethiobiotin synthetase [Desulfocicer vacuolatum DSM 3385]|uniref:ATP-dependent dethiobiotin synthetase BioD n=1 Tax=Desulfocicer vacuolatum DSM 3385 TaxID=1121400 RepID=A0A1W2DS43_9BACT|nr:dethiobiotin synthase [Desulfocicer vacuolatum]SMD00203.1 dethiobiotin synthetase [Desulfocicer vacuolatum DSM 3385]